MSLKRILVAVLIVGLGQLVLMELAAADVAKGPYIAVDGGLSWTPNLVYSQTYNCAVPPFYYPCGGTAYNAVTYNLGYSLGAQVGYAFGGPRVEFEYSYRNNGASTIYTINGNQSASGSLTANNYMVNVLYDFDTGSQWVPYIGLGLGMADVSAGNIHPSSSVPIGSFLDGSSNKFAVQFIFGAEYAVSEKVGVTIDWRGLWANNANFNYGLGCTGGGGTTNCAQTGTTNYNYWNGALNVGLRIKF
jgi:opacity protein-like surface antigen